MTFNEFALAHEPAIRLGAFFGVFAVMALWEAASPRRERLCPRRVRWVANLGLAALDSVVLRLAFPMAAVAFAVLAAERGWGLLNAFALPGWAALVVAVVALDFAIYLQHVTFHAVPALWRLHRVHHADPDYDVTTGARFHPIEAVLSMAIKLAVIAVLGAPAAAVLVFEVLLNATAMFNHANLRLPPRVDRLLRSLVVTPDMHRVHHSIEVAEANSNFGFNLPWWDRLFGTYRAAARLPQERMAIGVKGLTGSERCVRLTGLLALPFVGAGADPAIGHVLEPTREAP
ncbi:MAG TPA: sterol desaturase family protein [Rhodocyclaceae bacterium]|jgi:sterol desaturase/sphingolipid hydroxylase (fatty acid hydroxylase superfamily)|nr:sterol desaturase family protein [Rhodocyclaceae bacterium]